ncbi:MAG: DUF2071 domain-containing protein [Armatimonadetes bacterium]|nr:DUF2071 domain-containing protein [Armatimonadota bacterium]
MQTEALLALRDRPDRSPAMFHTWRHLSFLHWEADAAEMQALLPDGLTVETYEGKAYVGLVLFTMNGIRFAWLPEIPGANAFHETNVRTYVTDESGSPGVWFFSLDAANLFAVRFARWWFGLTYTLAKMSIDDDGHGLAYESERLRPPPGGAKCQVRMGEFGDVFEASPGTLEFWIFERYLLFAKKGDKLMTGRVWHKPYPIQTAECLECDESLTAALGITKSGPPDLVHYCKGVDVEVFAPQQIEFEP